MMASTQKRPQLPTGVSPLDSARYTRAMLANLCAMAEQAGQPVLARLLEAASREAERIVRAG